MKEKIKRLFRTVIDAFDRNYLSRVVLYSAGIALAAALVFYVGYHVLGRFSPGLELVDAVPKTITKTIRADAYIMRDEEPLYASDVMTGSIAPTVHDGGRVSIYSRIVDIYAQASPDIETRIEEIDEQIAILKKNQEEDRSVQSASGLDSRIYDEFFRIRSHSSDGNYAEALSLRTPLLVEIKKRAILTGEVTDYNSQIRLLEEERSSLRARLGSQLKSVYAPSAGWYFSEYDGYGEVFSSDKIDSMTFDEFEAMTEADPVFASGLNLGAMVHDYRWYIACRMPKADAAGMTDMYSCSVLFTYSGESLEMKLHRIVQETPGDESVVILRCEKMPENFDYTRMQPVEISTVEYTGYQVPIGALRVVDGYEGVYILDEVTVAFRQVHTIYRGDDFVICTGNPNPGSASDETEEPEETEPAETDEDGNPAAEKPKEPYWIRQNDIIIVSGTELQSGKVIG